MFHKIVSSVPTYTIAAIVTVFVGTVAAAVVLDGTVAVVGMAAIVTIVLGRIVHEELQTRKSTA